MKSVRGPSAAASRQTTSWYSPSRVRSALAMSPGRTRQSGTEVVFLSVRQSVSAIVGLHLPRARVGSGAALTSAAPSSASAQSHIGAARVAILGRQVLMVGGVVLMVGSTRSSPHDLSY